MVSQINSQAVKLLDVADDPRLSRGTKEFLKALNSTGVALEKLTPIEARQVLVDGQASVPGATVSNSNVKALVYIAGWALAPGDSISQLIGKYAPPPLVTAIAPDAEGFLYIDREKFHESFAHDIPTAEAQVMAVAQKPAASITFDQSVDSAAWETIPSWYLVAQEDRAINPELQRFMASRIGAKTTEIQASHVPYISRPREVADLIIEAASSAVE